MAQNRSLTHAVILYPESMPADYMDIIDALHCKAFLSPLHDRDKLPDGSLKKPHYHLLVIFSSVKTKDQWLEFISKLGCNSTHIETVASTSGYARYLCHLDNPEKAQYSMSDVRSFGGADYMEAIARVSDDLKILQSMMKFVVDNQVTLFKSFAMYCASCNQEWFRLLSCKHSVFMREFIKGAAYSYKNSQQDIYNQDGLWYNTFGEIIGEDPKDLK